jgi:hypothetical protein
MAREAGFQVADVDVNLMADAKVVRLARHCRDPRRTAVAVAMYEAVRLASWRTGSRVSLEDAAPAWYLDDVAEVQADLSAVGLLDADGMIPEGSWANWFGPAFKRREARRAAGSEGGKASSARNAAAALPEQPSSSAAALPEQPSSSREGAPSDAQPDRTDRTDRPSVRADARENGDADPVEVAVAWLARRKIAIGPSSKAMQTLVQLVEQFGVGTVIDVMAAVPGDIVDANQIVYGARNALAPIASGTAVRTVADDAADRRDHARARAATGARLREVEAIGPVQIDKTLADLGVERPR